MDHSPHADHGRASDPHASHKTSDLHEAHDRHAGHSVAMFRDKFWLSLALTIPVVFWSADVQHWLGYTAPSFPGSSFIPSVLGTLVFAYGGVVFLRGAVGELADRAPGMMTLISLAIIVAFATSLAATFGVFEIDVWWELASLITIMVLGHWLEMRAISQARATAYNLVAIPIAGGLLVRWGIDLPMSVGAIAMSASAIIVAANAQLLRGLNLQREFR
jgi:Cu2+-exporting ATPase